jgi:secreted PhoX family phosphatase
MLGPSCRARIGRLILEARGGKQGVSTSISRRAFLARSAAGLAAFALPATARASRADDFGPLLAPDANGLRLPAGFRSRIVARSNQVVGTTGLVWHRDPDGGAIFATDDGGWIYVSNSETDGGAGGVGALRFDASASLVDAYRILSGTSRNCAGGRTPWQTWLSCEEAPTGRVFECDPFARGSQGIVRPALGVFQHEAAAVDPVRRRIYLTEDRPDSLLYRFTPTAYPSLASGVLEAAQILDPGGQGPIAPGQTRPLAWHVVPDPLALQTQTRFQVASATRFNGGEGIDYLADQVFFTTKGDDRVWRIDLATNRIDIRYDRATSAMNALSGVDNLLATPGGDLYVAEDGGDLQIVALTTTGQVQPILQLTGQSDTEITGPALSPDGRRLYFSSQRSPGTTYEVEGPFLGPTTATLGGLPGLVLTGALALVAAHALRPGGPRDGTDPRSTEAADPGDDFVGSRDALPALSR